MTYLQPNNMLHQHRRVSPQRGVKYSTRDICTASPRIRIHALNHHPRHLSCRASYHLHSFSFLSPFSVHMRPSRLFRLNSSYSTLYSLATALKSLRNAFPSSISPSHLRKSKPLAAHSFDWRFEMVKFIAER